MLNPNELTYIKPVKWFFEEKINNFCMKLYNIECNRYSTFTDWEVYWMISNWVITIKIPYRTVVDYEMNRDKNKYSALKVDWNDVLRYWTQKNWKFYNFNRDKRWH